LLGGLDFFWNQQVTASRQREGGLGEELMLVVAVVVYEAL
jgi:hypothetical protein